MKRNTAIVTRRKTNKYKNNQKHLDHGTVVDRISNIGSNLGTGIAAGLASTIAMNYFLSNNSSNNSSNSQEHIVNELAEIKKKVNKIDEQTNETEGMLNKLQKGQTVIFNTLQEVGKTTANLVIQQINEKGVNLTKEQTQIITNHITEAIHKNGQPLTETQMKKVIDESLKEGKISTTEDVKTAVDNAVTTVTKDMNENFEDIKAGQTVIFNTINDVAQTIQKNGINLSNETIASITGTIINQLKNTKGISMLTKEQLEELANKICEHIKSNNTNINDNTLTKLSEDIKQIITTTKDTNQKVNKLLDQANNDDKENNIPPAPIDNQASQLYRDINADNDYGENSKLSNKEMLDYYGHKNGSKLTDYVILQKYKEFGQIDLKNEKQKLQEWDTIMHEYQNRADKISNYVEENGTRFGGHLFNTIGGEKFLTDSDLLEQGLSGRDIEIIKKYNLAVNGGDNDDKISKEEAINAHILGGATFTQHQLDNENKELFNQLGGEKNISTETDVEILKQLGFDPKEWFNKYKTTIGDLTGIVKGDFNEAAKNIDLKKINDYLDEIPNDAKKAFMEAVDRDGDGKISSPDELALGVKNIHILTDQEDKIPYYPVHFKYYNYGFLKNDIHLMDLYAKNPASIHFKYSEDKKCYVPIGNTDLTQLKFENDKVKDIVVNQRKLIDLGKISRADGSTIECVTLLDDKMKQTIAKTYGKENYKDCSPEEITEFKQKWQNLDENGVENLGALKNNMIIADTLFGDESAISTKVFKEKTIASFDKTDDMIKLLSYASGSTPDGVISKDVLKDKSYIFGQEFVLDKNGDGCVTEDEYKAYKNDVINKCGEERVNKEIFGITDIDNQKADNSLANMPAAETPQHDKQDGYNENTKSSNNNPTEISNEHGQETTMTT